MEAKISVLVPVYNVERTLKRCVESILNQTFQDFEVILIDDGSTDASGQICDWYAEQNPKIRVIHKTNEGLGPTRNCGVYAAKGEFLYHCDSDDWLKPDLLEKTYRTIIETDSDVVVFGYEIFTENHGETIPYKSVYVNSALYTNPDEVRDFFVREYYNFFIVLSACNRLYRRSFILENDLFFPAQRRCQDMAYSLLLFDHIQRLATIRETYYCYTIEPGVFKGRSFEEMVGIYQIIYRMTEEYFKKWGLYNEAAKRRLNGYACEQIANYSAYALVEKYPDQWQKNAKFLQNDAEIRQNFACYRNEKKSKFMKLFCMGMKIKSPTFLLCVSRLQQIIARKRR